MCKDCESAPNAPEVEAAVERLKDAIQNYAVVRGERNCIVTEAVVVYEEMLMDDEGTAMRAINWTIPTDNFSLAGAVGLLDMGAEYIKRDLIPVRTKNEEDDQ